ncbi:MAG TPA: M23 family metallopeptidase [Pyrinomonadaceae bacterium]|jgi:murein DD-endopeptidase MepM/ murein hydrolase activator NlpD
MGNRLRSKILLAFGAFALSLALLIWILSARVRQQQTQSGADASPTASPLVNPALSQPTSPATATVEASPQTTIQAPVITDGKPDGSTPAPSSSMPTSSTPTASTTPPPSNIAAAPTSTTANGSTPLLIPVAGVRREQLRDTFSEARSEGRVHDAIDIPAARGTPVVAAADGRIVKFFKSDKGGITIYQLSTDERLVYYYAHLERYAEGLAEGSFAHRGDVIAYVGDTGNAGPGNYHLHFSVAVITDPKRYWAGTNINPYPLLHDTK